MGKEKMSFYCHQNFVPNTRGYIHMVKHEKNVYKIGLQSIFFLNLQQMGKVIRAVCWHQKFVPRGLSALAPGLYTYIKSFKMCLKSYFKVKRKLATNGRNDKGFIYIKSLKNKNVYKIRFHFLNLQRMGKVTRAFCWHKKFVPKGLSVPALGLYTCIKSLNVFKIILKRENLQLMGKVIRAFCWHQHLSPRSCLPLPWGHIHV